MKARAAVRDLYRARASSFDRVSALYLLFGARLRHYRKLAVAALGVGAGARVADFGCGTGLALPFLERAVGERGEILGVDLTDAMLARARRRVEREGWRNVMLVEADFSVWRPPALLDGAISVLALGLAPDLDRAVSNVAAMLRSGARLAVVDLCIPPHVPPWLVDLGIRINRPFGIERALVERPLREVLARYLEIRAQRALFGGGVQLLVGERP